MWPTDADRAGTVSYSLTDTAGGRFSIDSTTGVVKVAAALDAETSTSHTITVLATSSDGSTNSADFTIAVTDVNDNAPVITTNASQSVNENAAFSVALASTDADTVGTNPSTFSITAGGDPALFSIVCG